MERRQERACERIRGSVGHMVMKMEGLAALFRGSVGHMVMKMERLAALIRGSGILHHCCSVVTLGRNAVLAACARMRCQAGLLDATGA